MSKIWIIVPVFNRKKDIYSLLSQFFAQTYDNFMVVVVDHGTTSIDFEKFDDPRLKVLKESSSLWWTGAVNAGIAKIQNDFNPEDFILLINDDVDIEVDYLQQFVSVSNNYPNAILGSICIDKNSKRIIYSCRLLNKLKARFYSPHKGLKYNDVKGNVKVIKSHILFGRGLFFPSRIINSIGLLDENNLPHYGADSEFSWRARKKGFDLFCSFVSPVYTDAKEATPRQVRKRDWIKYITDKRLSGNIYVQIKFSFLCFKSFYALYFVLCNFLRKFHFFIRRPSDCKS